MITDDLERLQAGGGALRDAGVSLGITEGEVRAERGDNAGCGSSR
jgi:hypothetical protein